MGCQHLRLVQQEHIRPHEFVIRGPSLDSASKRPVLLMTDKLAAPEFTGMI